ncbi:lysozyme inhibitor LprI family protein [Sodalis sp. RH13]
MERKFVLGMIVCFTCLSGAAHAAADCSKKNSDSEVYICALDNRVAAEKALNREYAAAKKRIRGVFANEAQVKKEYQAVFLAAQRNWLNYRENHCKLVAHVAEKNSNPYKVFTNECVTKLNEERVKELKRIPYD